MRRSPRAAVALFLAAALVVTSTGVLTGVARGGPRSDPVVVQNSDFPPSLAVEGTLSDDEVKATVDGDDWVIKSPGGIASFGCQTESPTRVRCVKYSGYFLVDVKDGDDTVELDGDRLRGRVAGGTGDDTLLGNSQRNVLDGNAGNDLIKGGGGPDSIYAHGDGHDIMLGQRGSDRLHADNRQSDRRLDCGRGDDKAVIDHGLDPKPVRCERIH